jgi:hypothetical protein
MMFGYNEVEADTIIIEAMLEKERYGQLSPQTKELLELMLERNSYILKRNKNDN